MGTDEGERRLAAILSADVAGYSKLMGDDERATVRTLTEYRKVFSDHVARHKGHVVDTAGDSVLAVFGSVVEAVQCAVNVQSELAVRNSAMPKSRRMDFRVGINLGDIIEQDDGTIYGDGVNVAARLEALAEPGGIAVSGTVFDHAENKLPVEFEPAGEHEIKNIAKPVRVFRVRGEPGGKPKRHWFSRRKKFIKIAATGILAVAAAAAAVTWQMGPDKKSALPTIAVLPFDNLGGDPEEEYFADGMTEELIAQLAQFRDLSVIARNSMFTYKGRAVDVRTVGDEMGADYVLEGSVRRSADRIRLTAQLLSASNGKHLWAQSYDRNLTAAEVFALQDDLANQVATEVAGNYGIIATTRLDDAGRKPPDKLQSYECVLRSYAFIRLQTPELHLAARNCLERTLSSDSQYAKGWAWLANMYLEEYGSGFNAGPEPLERARQSLQQAIHSGPDDPTVVLMHARLLYFEKDPRFFERARQAVAVNPRDTYALGEMGFSLALAGSWEEGIALSERAIALSRVHPGWYHWTAGWKAYLDGNYRDGLSHAQRGPMPGFYWYHVLLTMLHARLGQTEDAFKQAAMIRETNPSFEANAYAEFWRWNWQQDAVEQFVAGLREAGMNIPSERSSESAGKNQTAPTAAQN